MTTPARARLTDGHRRRQVVIPWDTVTSIQHERSPCSTKALYFDPEGGPPTAAELTRTWRSLAGAARGR